MIKFITYGFVSAIVAILTYVAFQAPEYSISREILVRAAPEVIFPFINSSRKANDWMPWAESDPAVRLNFSGPDEGVGSISSWDSTGPMGSGKAEVVESISNQSVKTQLTYTKPMEMSQLAEIALNPGADGTVVTWSVTGKNNFVGRLICLFMNMDQMVGGEFEKGLGKLKRLVEAGSA